MKDITRFISERFELKGSLPIALILYGGISVTMGGLSLGHFVRGWAAVWLSLLALRIFDDLGSIEVDALSKPDRGLVSGRINPTALKAWGACLPFLVALLFFSKIMTFAVLIMTLYYTAYFIGRRWLPLLLKPMGSNLFFLCLPSLMSLWLLGEWLASTVILGLFCWIAAFAHDYVHDIRDESEPQPPVPDYTSVWGSFYTSLLATACYGFAALLGILYFLFGGFHIGFLLPLLFVSAWLFVLLVKLINKPCVKNSKPFYIAGYAFFLLPLLGQFATGYLFHLGVRFGLF